MTKWTPRRLWISDRNHLSYFRSTSYPNISYQVSSQPTFLRFAIGTTFYLQVAQILSTKLRVNLSFGSGEEAHNRFLRWRIEAILDIQ